MNFKCRFYIFSLLGFLILMSSCSDYQKLLKSTDYEKKYERAKYYYDKKDYPRSLSLLEELLTIYKGTSKAEEIYFLYSYCYYYEDDYIMAGYYFQDFAKMYPQSLHSEEAEYMGAYCFFLESPDFSLDQANTVKAIQQLQLFINHHSQSERLVEANKLIDELRYKLETKSYSNAKLYFDIGEYKAAIISFKNTLKDFPDSSYREQIMFMILQASYLLAANSITEKKNERLQDTVDNYNAFKSEFPGSSRISEADKIYNNTKIQLVNN
ncbi:MAG: outer membrane protein assembly factor BamD [Bacteroidia bacterium]|nr:outer membrane protein assembly factor BamD [Bacteroidia bacterium]